MADNPLGRTTEVAEFQDPEEELEKKLRKICKLVQNAKHLVVFTGAGVSTASGISDFQAELNADGVKRSGVLGCQEGLLDSVMPTYAHVALVKLMEAGHVKFIVTSNHDNLHRKAGTPAASIAEIFGNAYVEVCQKCKTQYTRSVIVPQLNRRCDNPACKGRLVKHGVRYGEATPEEPLRRAEEAARQTDVALVLGSSMGTSPFCILPPMAEKMILCGLQQTRYDDDAAVAIHTTCDRVMREVTRAFGVDVGSYTYRQRFAVEYEKQGGVDKYDVRLVGGYPNEPCTCLEEVCLWVNGAAMAGVVTLEYSQMTFVFSGSIDAAPGATILGLAKTKAEFGVDAIDLRFQLDASGRAVFEYTKIVSYD